MLEPGDRGIIAVGPWKAVPVHTSWSCSRCSRWFDPDDSWRVDYRHSDGSEYSFVVCPSCAAGLRPLRLTIDLTTLKSSRDADLAPLASLVRWIAGRRSQPPDALLSLRWSDVHLLAEMYEQDPVDLQARLRRAGVAVADPDQRLA
ncbi:MAG: hypothetical protein R3320_13170 [Nitriliruptorales bacterium]|nr:hypothetical protein [Nitriliruptorales bacterium]